MAAKKRTRRRRSSGVKPGQDFGQLLYELAVVKLHVCEAAGLSRQALYQLIKGANMPHPLTEARLAVTLGVPRERIAEACRVSCRRAGRDPGR